ncbi:MAG: GTPase Era [Melioribacteraceae bacterium]|nr:GTPase Era [Melioribacteraceae bacterium]MCF8356379.1 GTPase Era [Melioribacteraceae bacterium]MCF8395762.1 GTPase Era [Melioribacteraceae bacterium]MCF8420895.1 GTPase Era [Melioribacteraceae bacterium]
MSRINENVKTGYVTIIGKPNAGKSTLMNALLSEKLSIITNKPQTTRKRVLGILSDDETQIIVLDTPGILQPNYLLQERMMDHVHLSVKDADVIILIIDIDDDPRGDKSLNDDLVRKILRESNKKKILLINKIDLANETLVESLIKIAEKLNVFERIIPVSALKNFGMGIVMDTIKEFLPFHPKLYPDDQVSDETERFFVSEIIRENIFELYKEEVPYSTEVQIEDFIERPERKDYVRAAIIVERDSQKPILIGNKGDMIKRLGKNSREDIESFLQREVYLELFVKVKSKWRSNSNLLNNFGYAKLDDE